jgi:hypothetical protein
MSDLIIVVSDGRKDPRNGSSHEVGQQQAVHALATCAFVAFWKGQKKVLANVLVTYCANAINLRGFSARLLVIEPCRRFFSGPMMDMWPCTWVRVTCSVQRNGLCWMRQQPHDTSQPTCHIVCRPLPLPLLKRGFPAVSPSSEDFSRQPKHEHPLHPSNHQIVR